MEKITHELLSDKFQALCKEFDLTGYVFAYYKQIDSGVDTGICGNIKREEIHGFIDECFDDATKY